MAKLAEINICLLNAQFAYRQEWKRQTKGSSFSLPSETVIA
jgi:hypothetical protein